MAENVSEFHFTSEAGRDPQVDDTLTYTNPLSGNIYAFMSNAYHGSGGFRDGSYLAPHTRELFYENRKKISHYRNYIKPIIRALTEPVFMEDAPRIITDETGNEISEEGSHMFSTFIEDCDNNKRDLQSFTNEAINYARLHGVTFVVVDNFPDSVQPDTEKAAIDERIMPYVYLQTADKVEEYETDDFGHLLSITFEIDPIVNNQGKEVKRYRRWDLRGSVVMSKDGKGDLVEIEPMVEHGLDVIPVLPVIVGKRRENTELLVDPPLLDIARVILSIFNKDSEIRDQERAQAFANFYIQSDETGNITLGAHNVIFIPSDTQIPPGFASPDPSILSGLVENNEKLVESLYQIAEQNGVKGVQSAKSGVAIQWDFYGTETQLRYSSSLATNLEHRIAKLFMAYTGTKFVYVVSYPDDFLPGDTSKEIETYKIVINDLRPPQSFKNKLLEKTARMLLADEDPKELQDIIDDIMAQKEPELNPVGGGANADNFMDRDKIGKKTDHDSSKKDAR